MTRPTGSASCCDLFSYICSSVWTYSNSSCCSISRNILPCCSSSRCITPLLGGLNNPKSVCGWVGPVPAPQGWSSSAWIKINARAVDVPIPVSTSQLQLTLHGLELADPAVNESPEAALESITDIRQWIQALGSSPRNDVKKVEFKALRLTEVAGSTAAKERRATVDFTINNVPLSYVLYSNPLFVCAPTLASGLTSCTSAKLSSISAV